ncbi:phosphogluconate dehydrogenase (NAD(+)-dependent, decarboxylating) [Bifidobacterium actinocoloniiforme]|uniref:phosphogluconate dehydrogenase (NAD(+)-dependent, decarboxylating) n=1 Tax=Bifidobacterium actinocoloniiforme TaxID=638619 RepID=UPI002E816A63|nr:decarboxylating 6-phosphogluconate dehydrogenase [Bifidobacterium actinocoloniiforme]
MDVNLNPSPQIEAEEVIDTLGLKCAASTHTEEVERERARQTGQRPPLTQINEQHERKTTMQIGMIGLGRMGLNMAERIKGAGHQVVGYDLDPDSGRDVDSLEALVGALQAPRAIWVMVPAGKPTEETIGCLYDLLEPGDLVIDGGNTHFTQDMEHAKLLSERGIGLVDVGTSNGIWGKERGYALMAGGSDEDFERILPILEALKPEGENGLVHAGGIGAGHYAKMVHNGIEYGMMQALAEGYAIMQASPLVKNPDQVAASWREGSVIKSWLLDLMVKALQEDPGLEHIAGKADESGEAKWMIQDALKLGVPVPVTTASLYARQGSKISDPITMKVVSALREQFGGHPIAKE